MISLSLSISHDYYSDISSFMWNSIGLLKRILWNLVNMKIFMQKESLNQGRQEGGIDIVPRTSIHIEYICAHISFIMLLVVASLDWVVLSYKF